MRYISLIFLFSIISGYGQEIKYNLFLKDSCSGKLQNSFTYYLEQNGSQYMISDLDNGTIILPAKGVYKVVASDVEEEHIIIIDNFINSDTLILPKIIEKILSPPYSYKAHLDKEVEKRIRQKNLPTFWICDKKINGKSTDYFSNGTPRISGTFINGLPVGEMKRYYQNGNLKEISTYDKDGFLINKIHFAEDGNLIEE